MKNNCFKNLILPLLLSSTFSAAAEIYVDIDKSGRNSSEVTEPSYTAWTPDVTNTLTVSGVTFKLTSGASSGSLSTNWYKAGVQSPSYARLVCDCAYIKDCTSKDAALVLEISGLSAGTHSLLSYHNAVDDFSSSTLSNMDIYVDGKKVQSNIVPTKRALSTAESKTAYISFTATVGKSVTIKYVVNTSSSVNTYNVYLNGFALDVPNASDQASAPSPSNNDKHVDGDDGKTVTLSWTAASSAKSHNVYFGTDSASVASASTSSNLYKGNVTSTSYSVSKLSCNSTYYWRVDEVTSSGAVTKGTVWNFRPRRLAFPGAEGYGKYATGGRGGKVVYVTNLNDDGAGSFREAITNEIGPRTIVFAVSGVIELKSRLTCSSDYVTIAGQTAPGRGICIKAAPFGVGSESICQFIRVRLGSGDTYDGLGMAGAKYSITDHCSVGWTIDEAFSSRNAKNMTLQKTLISEALNIANHKNYPAGTGHGYAATIGGDIGSFHHNLLAHNYGRNWSMGGGLDGNGYYAGRLDIFNNVVYNFGGRVTDGGAMEVNFVGNYYKKGAASKLNYTLSADLEGTGKGYQAYYFHNNILQEKDGSFICDGTNDECGRQYTLSNGQQLTWNVWNSKPFFESQATIESAQRAYKTVLSDVGCNMPVFDNHDVRMVKETLEGTYYCTGAQTKLGGIIDANSESKEGDYSYYTSETRASNFDSDLDGLPDWYETVIGTNKNSASGDFSDANADPDGDGYTNLEEYLYYMSVPHVEMATGVSKTFDLTEYFMGFSKTKPSYSVAENSSNLTISISGSKLTVSSAKGGIFYYKVKVTDEQNDVMTRTFAVYIEGSTETTAVLNKCGGGSSNQSIKLGESITNFCYTWEDATTVETSGFPKGITLNIDNSARKIDISGTPTKVGEYKFTVTTVGATTNATKTGSIIVTRDPVAAVYTSESTDLWTNAERWNSGSVPMSVDTAYIRSGEVKVAETPSVSKVIVEENGIFRITATNIEVSDLVLQGGTLKSYTSTPVFSLSSAISVEKNSTILAGSVETSVFEIKGTIWGSGDIEKTSVGTLKLTADASDFTGLWTISGGKLQVNNENALGSKGVSVSSSATLDIAKSVSTGDLMVAEGGIVNFNNGETLTVENASFAGQTLTKGSYTSADFPDFITGDGTLVVTTGESTDCSLTDAVSMSIFIAPNPVIDNATLYITSDQPFTDCQYSVLNTQGIIGETVTFDIESGENTINIDFSRYNVGVYFVKIVTPSSTKIVKVVVR